VKGLDLVYNYSSRCYNPEFDTYMTKKRLESLLHKGSGVFAF